MIGEPARPPEAEEAMGLSFYASRLRGIGGRVKETPEDFRVTEISSYPLPDPAGAFTVLRVRSQDWEQHELAAELGRRLGLPPHSVRWAGTKDRRAVSERLFSYRGRPPSRELGLRNVTLLEAYSARDGLVLGHHYGNSFEIRVTGLESPGLEAGERCRAILEELRSAGGFPNFFGLQRFGEVRPITAEVGRLVAQGDLAGAVDAYLVAPPPYGRPGPGDEARQAYAEHRDPVRALREFPHEYRFERTLLEQLARGHSPDRAFRALPRELRLLFVHAFQSLLFNRWLGLRHASGLPYAGPVPGDAILRMERDGTVRGQDPVPVGPDNRRECEELVGRGRALVAGPLIGYETRVEEGAVGDLLRAVLASEGAEPAQFRLPATPELASRGAWRPVVVPTPPVALAPGPTSVTLGFALPRGSYATVLLREFLKNP